VYPSTQLARLCIRQARPEDAATITRFNCAMALETEGLRLDEDRVKAGVQAVLEDPSKGFYLLAELDGHTAGQLMVTYEWSDWRNGVFWWIQSVYVDPDHRRQGVFTALFRYLLELARQTPGVCGLRLYVEVSNQVAQAVYARLGLERAPYEIWQRDFVILRKEEPHP